MAVYTHGHHDSVLRGHSARTIADSAEYLRPHLTSQTRILDVGAGPGTITVDFASHVAQVTATEVGAEELALSQRLAADRGITNIDFSIEDIRALSFPADTFDIAHVHQVLQHVGDPVRALQELRRVTKPGGIVAAREADYAGFFWYPALPELDEWMRLYQTAARANGGEPDAGRHLASWARAAGFTEIEVSSSNWIYADPAGREHWGGMWADRIRHSAMAQQLTESGLATASDLAKISDAWRRWTTDPDAMLLLPNVEILCRA